jgi:hypothetical protein
VSEAADASGSLGLSSPVSSSSSSPSSLPDLTVLSRPLFSPEQLHALAAHSLAAAAPTAEGVEGKADEPGSDGGEGDGPVSDSTSGAAQGDETMAGAQLQNPSLDSAAFYPSEVEGAAYVAPPLSGPSSGLPPYPLQVSGHVSLPARPLVSPTASSPVRSMGPTFAFSESTSVAVQSRPQRSFFMNETLRERLLFQAQLTADRLQPEGHTRQTHDDPQLLPL